MMFCKNITLENVQKHVENLFSETTAMIPYDLYPLGEEPGNIGTPTNRND